MLSSISIWLLKSFFTPTTIPLHDRKSILLNVFHLPRITVLITFFLLSSFVIYSQDQTLNYNIFYKGNIVGNMQINKRVNNENVYLMMVSRVRMKVFTSFRVYIEEQSLFNKGKLMYTSVYREVNGKVKANQKTKAIGDVYQTDSEGKTGTIPS